MRLRQWLDSRPRGELARLVRETGLMRATISYLAREVRPAKYDTAVLISAATQGAVTVEELCVLPRRKRRGKKRT